MPVKRGEKAKASAQDVTAIRAALGKRGAKNAELDALLTGKAGNKSRREVVGDLIAWLRDRPKAKE